MIVRKSVGSLVAANTLAAAYRAAGYSAFVVTITNGDIYEVRAHKFAKN